MTATWSGKALRKLGECIRDDVPVPAHLPQYDDVLLHYSDVVTDAQQKIIDLDWSLILPQPPQITSRVKTLDTLREKLRRDRDRPLNVVQDLAGIRVEAEMSLVQQDLVAQRIAQAFGHEADSIRDLREGGHSGYRAVHIRLRVPERVEVQVRTHLQGQWANLYELVADVMGRYIRYDELPESEVEREVVLRLQEMSTERIAALESGRATVEVVRAVSTPGVINASGYSEGEDLPEDVADLIRLREQADQLEGQLQDGERRIRSTLQELHRRVERMKERR